MFSDSIANASIPSGPNSRDFGKKKRANRSAKLKQCKLDARREQWLSQGSLKNKGCKEETRGSCASLKERERSLGNLEMRQRPIQNEVSIQHESDLDSPSNSPSSLSSSVLSVTHSSTNFTGSSSSSSSSSGGCCSGSITEEEEGGDDGCMDDWEAVADALAAHDKQENENLFSGSLTGQEPPAKQDSRRELTDGSEIDFGNPKQDCRKEVPRAPANCRAWRPDDAFRPQSLPNLSKQYSFPTSGRHFGQGVIPWASNSATSLPSSCPICCEDLDLTDSSFLPCSCGFRLCLFCHKRILEEDGRCPGCRKPYEHNPVEAEASVHGGSLTFRLGRSCSMIERI